MEQVKEDVIVNVNDSEIIIPITDYDYTIELGQEYEKEIYTEKIIGELKSIILSTNQLCDISVSFYEVPIVIYHNMQFNDIAYIPVKVLSQDSKADLLNFSSSEWILNNRLNINVKGQQNTIVTITFRCKKYG